MKDESSIVKIRRLGLAIINRMPLKPLTHLNINTKNGTIEIVFEKTKYSFWFDFDQDLLADSMTLIWEQFWHENLKELSVEGRQVLDIGGNIGDSAVYFAHRGARQIIYVEPYPNLYRIAETNFRLNKLDNVVLIKNPMGHSGVIEVDQSKRAEVGASIGRDEKGKKVRCYSLKEIVNEYGLSDAVLKSDCEGAEYDFILDADKETLRHFRQMQIEYHLRGHKILEKHLSMAGFATRAKFPLESPELEQQVGFIWADRQ